MIVREISLADTRRLFTYKQELPIDVSLNLKGFDYAWILQSRTWRAGEKVLDVGGAYSSFPNYLSKTYGCETWVVDDFGIKAQDEYWTREKSPEEHFKKHPETKYVLERVGNPAESTLPLGYFDVVYSASALEHVPAELTPAVWKHMQDLVKPGGELIHAVDMLMPSNGGLPKMVSAWLFDNFPWLFPTKFKVAHHLATPANYTRIAEKAMGMKLSVPMKSINIWRMSLDPEIVVEPMDYGWNRIRKDGMDDYRHHRFGSLLLHFKKK